MLSRRCSLGGTHNCIEARYADTVVFQTGVHISDDELFNCPRATDIAIYGSKNATFTGTGFAHTSMLKTLTLHNCSTFDANNLKYVSNSLTHFSIWKGNEFTDSHLSLLPNVSTLKIGYQPITDKGLGLFTDLEYCVLMSCPNITTAGIQKLRKIIHLFENFL